MSSRAFIATNLVFAAIIIFALVFTPHSDFDVFPRFLFVCSGTFVVFCVLAFIAKRRFLEASLYAALWSFVTLLFALVLNLFVNGFGPCAFVHYLRLC